MADATGLRNAALKRYNDVAHAGAAQLERDLRTAAPKKTRALENSIRVTVSRRGATRWVLEAVSPLIQAATTNTGARPHVIRPKKPGGRLVFYWPKVGRVVYLRKVNHPGNRGTHWWDKVIASGRRSMWAKVLQR